MTRLMCAIVCAALVGSCGLLEDSEQQRAIADQDYFPLAPGNRWEYERYSIHVGSGAVQSRTIAVVGPEGEWTRAAVTLRYHDLGSQDTYSAFYRLTENAVILTATPGDTFGYDTLCTIPVTRGASWRVRGWDVVGPMEVVSVGTTVTVPAGVFSDVVATRLELSLRWHVGADSVFWARYFAPYVGHIKTETIVYRDGGRILEDQWVLTDYHVQR